MLIFAVSPLSLVATTFVDAVVASDGNSDFSSDHTKRVMKQSSNFKSKICRHYLLGRCEVSGSCRFSHGDDDHNHNTHNAHTTSHVGAIEVSINKHIRYDYSKTRLCKLFIAGDVSNCPNGDNCANFFFDAQFYNSNQSVIPGTTMSLYMIIIIECV